MRPNGRRSEFWALLAKLGYDHKGNYAAVFDVTDRLRNDDPAIYRALKLPKPSGGVRVVHAPDAPLLAIQKRIHGRILRKAKVHRCCAAYIRDFGPVDAARKMTGDLAVLRLDIENFFPSITEARVAGVLRGLGAGAEWGGEKSVFWLAKLCCYRGRIVQGAPTSPAISNLVCRQLDDQLARLAKSWGLNYLRYSDDMFFYGAEEFNGGKLAKGVAHIIAQHGFVMNAAKTRDFAPGAPRRLLGLNTHGEGLRIPRTRLREMRAAFANAARDPLAYRGDALPRLQGLAGWYVQVYGPADVRGRGYGRVVRELRMSERAIKWRQWLRRVGVLGRLG